MLQDIAEVYAGRSILVRAVGVSGRTFLGSVKEAKGNWLECNELHIGPVAERIELQVFLMSIGPQGWQECLVCQGMLLPEHKESSKESKRSRLSSGTYECKLVTTIRNHSSNATQDIKVGKIRLQLVVDNGKITSPYKRMDSVETSWLVQEIASLASADEMMRMKLFKVVYLMGLIDIEDVSKKAVNLQILDRLLRLLVSWKPWAGDLLGDLAGFVVQLQLQERLLFLFNMYFEDWLTSDILQELIALSQLPADMQIRAVSLSPPSIIDEEEEKVYFMEKALICLAVSAILHDKWILTFLPPEGTMDSAYIQEIAPDLLTAVLAFKLAFLKKILSGMTAAYEKQVSLLCSLQDMESFLFGFHRDAVTAAIDSYSLACSHVQLKHLIQMRTASWSLTLANQGQFLRCTAQHVDNMSVYLQHLVQNMRNAPSAVRICGSHLHVMDLYAVLIRKMMKSITYFSEYLSMETILTNALDIVRNTFCKALHISSPPVAISKQSEEEDLESKSAAFQAITCFLELGEVDQKQDAGSTEVKAARRPSYASISRDMFSGTSQVLTLKRVIFDEEDRKAMLSGTKEVVAPILTFGPQGSALQGSPLATHIKFLTLKDKKADAGLGIVQDDHDFYHTLDQMPTHSGSAMMIVLELCKPFFTCLHSLASTATMLYELHSQKKLDCLRKMFSNLHVLVSGIFEKILMDNAFTVVNVQVILTRYLQSSMHVTVHMRAGLLAFLHFITGIDRLYGTCAALRACSTGPSADDMDRHVHTLTAYSALCKVLHENPFSHDCNVLDGYSTNGIYYSYLQEITGGSELANDSLYPHAADTTALCLSLRDRAIFVLTGLLTIFSSELSRPQGQWEVEMVYMLSTTTALAGMQACCSVLRSVTNMKLLYQANRKPDWIRHLDQLYGLKYLQNTTCLLLKTVGDLHEVSFQGEHVNILQQLLGDIRSFLLQMALEVVLVTKPTSSSRMHMLAEHKSLLDDRKAAMGDFFVSQLTRVLLHAYRSGLSIRTSQSAIYDLLKLGMDDNDEVILSEHQGYCVSDLLEVLTCALMQGDGNEDLSSMLVELSTLAMQCNQFIGSELPGSARKGSFLPALSPLLQLNNTVSRCLYWISRIKKDTCNHEGILPVVLCALRQQADDLRNVSKGVANWSRYMGSSPAAYMAFMLFYVHRLQEQDSHTHREKELQHLRDCLSAFVATGHWEAGLQIAQQYKAWQMEKALIVAKEAPSPRVFSPAPRQLAPFSFDILSPRSPISSRQQAFFSSPGGLSPFKGSTVAAGAASSGDVSPQRIETIKSELGRVISKLEEKLKHEGLLRLPSVYYALRFTSATPFSIDPSKLTSDDLLPCIGMEKVNISALSLQALGQGGWFEQWYLLRYDMSSVAAAAGFYSEYLKACQREELSGTDGPRTMGDICHPLSFHRTQAQLAKHFPDFTLLPNFINLEGILGTMRVASGPVSFLQCYPAYVADICKDAHDLTLYSEPLLRYKERKLRKHDDAEEDEEELEEQEEESSDEEGTDGEVIDSGDLNDLLEMREHKRDVAQDMNDAGKWRIKKTILDKQYISFTTTPSAFYVYSNSSKGNGEVCRLTLSTSNCAVRVNDITPNQPQPSPAGEEEKEQDEAEVVGGMLKKAKEPSGPLLVTASTMCPLASAVHLAIKDLPSPDACVEVMLHINVMLARAYRSMKHCNSLTSTELSNQPAGSLLHSDHIFQSAFCLLSNLLTVPAANCVGLTNIDAIVSDLRCLSAMLTLLPAVAQGEGQGGVQVAEHAQACQAGVHARGERLPAVHEGSAAEQVHGRSQEARGAGPQQAQDNLRPAGWSGEGGSAAAAQGPGVWVRGATAAGNEEVRQQAPRPCGEEGGAGRGSGNSADDQAQAVPVRGLAVQRTGCGHRSLTIHCIVLPTLLMTA